MSCFMMKFTFVLIFVLFATPNAFAPRPNSIFGVTITNAVTTQADISVALVKDLRQLTGAGMMDCKRALKDTNGDVDLAMKQIHKSGNMKDNKTKMVSTEGRIMIKSGGDKAVIVEINCQTDFVANDELFLSFANKVAESALVEEQKVCVLKEKFQDNLSALVAKIGENIEIRRLKYIRGEQLAVYTHNGGKIGVVVSGKGEDIILKKMCMHICASSSQYIRCNNIPDVVVEKENSAHIDISTNVHTSHNVANSMAIGRIEKLTGEVSLLDQPFVMDRKLSVGDMLKKEKCELYGFIRLEVGEDIS